MLRRILSLSKDAPKPNPGSISCFLNFRAFVIETLAQLYDLASLNTLVHCHGYSGYFAAVFA
jgi:hypothetical protein